MLRKILPILLLLVFVYSCSVDDKDAADLVLKNAKIYTLKWDDPDLQGNPSKNAPFTKGLWTPDAEAIAIKNNTILFVGTNNAIENYIGNKTKVIDVNNAYVIPGLIESHGHLQEIGEKKEAINLQGLTKKEILNLIIEKSKKTPEGEWIVASGWDEAEFVNDYPDLNLLSEKTPNHPVVLIGLRGFGVMGNALAFKKANITTKTIAKNGGEILKNNEGNLKFVLINQAKRLLLDKVPQKSLEQQIRIMNYGFEKLLRLGFTTTHNLGVDKNHMNVYESLLKQKKLPMRVHAFIAARKYNLDLVNKWLKKGPTNNPNSFLQVRSFKGYFDGSLGSRGAKFLEEYSDKKGHTGVSGNEYGFIDTVMINAMDKGFQLAIHAIGDKANRDVLDLYENYFKNNPTSKKLRHRIEHVQVLHPNDFERFSKLNIIASMEPAHAVEDMPWAIDRIGNERAKGAYAWRTLRENGAKVIFNSDFTGSNPSFFYALHAATTKKNLKDNKVYFPEQSFTKEEVLRAYTIWAAYASHHENLTGTLEKGKWADVTVIDVDILNESPEKILKGNVLYTIINGKIAYAKNPKNY